MVSSFHAANILFKQSDVLSALATEGRTSSRLQIKSARSVA